ncbi:MAG: hypothetical protein J6C60_03490 [Alistipes sp.]|nr:hypothetical protein [Alistipes sp.]MBP3474490.1 hypothetical protein [Alistipes sp.]
MKLKNPFIDESALEGDDGPKKSEDEVLMDEAKQHTKVEVVETYMALGMVIGLAAGAAVGSLLLGRMNIGMGLGMLIGLVAGSCIHKKPKEQATEEQKAEEQPAEEQRAEEQAAKVVEQAAARDDNEETKE